MMTTKVVLLGTGTPNPNPKRSGPSIALIVDEQVYLVDFGAGVVRRAIEAGIKPSQLTIAFLTHFHSDHTVGYPDLIFTPAVVGVVASLSASGSLSIERRIRQRCDPGKGHELQGNWPCSSGLPW